MFINDIKDLDMVKDIIMKETSYSVTPGVREQLLKQFKNQRFAEGSFLHLAILRNDLDLFKELIAVGVNVEIQNDEYQNALLFLISRLSHGLSNDDFDQFHAALSPSAEKKLEDSEDDMNERKLEDSEDESVEIPEVQDATATVTADKLYDLFGDNKLTDSRLKQLHQQLERLSEDSIVDLLEKLGEKISKNEGNKYEKPVKRLKLSLLRTPAENPLTEYQRHDTRALKKIYTDLVGNAPSKELIEKAKESKLINSNMRYKVKQTSALKRVLKTEQDYQQGNYLLVLP